MGRSLVSALLLRGGKGGETVRLCSSCPMSLAGHGPRKLGARLSVAPFSQRHALNAFWHAPSTVLSTTIPGNFDHSELRQ